MRDFKNILVTGGAGFIGSNFIRYILNNTEYTGRVINYDKLTYAGNLENLIDIEKNYSNNRYVFIKGDICDDKKTNEVFKMYDIDCVVNFAAESHVDRSIYGPKEFIKTNINGTFNLLEKARKYWLNNKTKNKLFHHVSTDEVYGSLNDDGFFHETTSYDPRSPYSASKASSDHLVRSYFHTYGLPVTISNCSNNYGPYQYPEKLIPVMILSMLNKNKLPVYGDGSNIRDWLYVIDHADAIWKILKNGETGETYNVGGENEWTNIKLVEEMCYIMDKIKPPVNVSSNGNNIKSYSDLISFVKDRPGHDYRYAINCDKIKEKLNWTQTVDFKEGLKKTIKWYLNSTDWIDKVLKT